MPKDDDVFTRPNVFRCFERVIGMAVSSGLRIARRVARSLAVTWVGILIVVNAVARADEVSADEVRIDESRQPLNVVFILVDDLGWSDLGCYGSDFYETPAIDALAKRSLKFNQAYAAAPVCSPTRAAILTGKSPARLDMTIWHEGAVEGGPKDRPLRDAKAVANLPHHETTLAEHFQQAGYRTIHIGKWHLGIAAHYPETQGFDVNIGGSFWGAPPTFFAPFAGPWSQHNPEWRYVPGLHDSEANYLTDALTDEALRQIERNADRPFFLNLWFHTVHSPIEAPEDVVARFRNKTPGEHHRDPTYAAMVHRMDANVGRVLHKLDQLGLRQNTVVIFTSDNGGVDFPQRGILPTSNYPLRSGKGTLFEGGLRVPLLIRWPGKPVGETDVWCTSEDFYPTLRYVLMPTATDQHPAIVDHDGIDLTPVINDPHHKLPKRTLYWHFPHYYPRMTPSSALRSEDWKLIHRYQDDAYQLYRLDVDPGEQHDVSGQHPQVVQRLRGTLNAWRDKVAANRPTLNEQFTDQESP